MEKQVLKSKYDELFDCLLNLWMRTHPFDEKDYTYDELERMYRKLRAFIAYNEIEEGQKERVKELEEGRKF